MPRRGADAALRSAFHVDRDRADSPINRHSDFDRRLAVGLPRTVPAAGHQPPRRQRGPCRGLDSRLSIKDLSESLHHRHRALPRSSRDRLEQYGRPSVEGPIHPEQSGRPARHAMVGGRAAVDNGRAAGPDRRHNVLAGLGRRDRRTPANALAALREQAAKRRASRPTGHVASTAGPQASIISDPLLQHDR